MTDALFVFTLTLTPALLFLISETLVERITNDQHV